MNYTKGIRVNLLLLILLAAAAAFLFRPARPGIRTEEDNREIPILDYHVGDIAAVALIHGDVRFGLLHKEGMFALEPVPADGKLSQQKLQSFLYRLSKLTAQGMIRSPGNGKEQYGLEKPLAQSTIILNDGSKVRLALGKKHPFDNSYYLLREERDDVYIISGEDAAMLLSEPPDFLNRQVLPAVDLKDLNTLEFIKVSSGKNQFRIENRGDFVFTLTEPIVNTVDYERILSDLIFPVLSLTPGRTADPESDLPPTPETAVSIGIAGEVYELKFYPRDEGSYYLTSSGFPGIFLLEEEIPFSRLQYADLMNGSIYHTNISEIQGIVIQDRISGMDYNIDLSGESVNLRGQVNGISVDYPEIMEFAEVFLKTGIGRKLPDIKQLDETDKKTMSIQIYKKNGSMNRLDFSPEDEGEQILYIDGTANFITYTKTVLDIQSALTELIQKDGV